jgi:Spy/CpxP family protein refolding chaperone
MKRPSRILIWIGLAVAASALPAFADDDSGHMGPGHHGQKIQKCLSVVDLTADQQSAIDAILASGKTTMQADFQGLRNDHQKLKTDMDNGADKSVVGQDTITVHSDEAKLKADSKAIRDQVLAKLTPDQQNKVNGCLESSGHFHGSRPNSSGSTSSGSTR